MTALHKLRRAFEFARHIPLEQIAHRGLLKFRRAKDRIVEPTATGDTPVDAHPAAPVFTPRAIAANLSRERWSFTFFGHTISGEGLIQWRRIDTSPADQLWRMNLHYMEYLEGFTDSEFIEAIGQWATANRPGSALAHTDSWNAYTISLRSVVWMQQLAIRPDLPASFRKLANGSLSAQIAYLESHLERDIGGNHLLKNAKALIWAGQYFAGPQADNWQRKGLSILRRELGAQFLSDGMQFERSPSYHCQTLADLIEMRHALNGDPLDGALDAAIMDASQVASDLAHPDGKVALFGDSGLSMAYAPEQCIAALSAIGLPRPAARRSFALSAAGYYGLRTPDSLCVLDAGQLGPDSLPGHAHGDMMSFEWSLAGRRIVVDQGVYQYYQGPRRDCSRAAANHNTLAVEGCDQAEFFGSFRMGRRGRLTVVSASADSEQLLVKAQHDGFVRTGGGPIHLRQFLATKNAIEIEDRLIGGQWLPASQALLLAPDVVCELSGDREARLSIRGFSITVESDHPMTIEDAVWWPDMGRELQTRRLRIKLEHGARKAQLRLSRNILD